MTFGVENTGDKTQNARVGRFYLVDENGDRWEGESENGHSYEGFAVAAGTRRRIRWSFKPEKRASGTVFALTDRRGNLLLRDLR